ncbi:MAG: hypothetical protein RL607_1636 [Bacteroidota bacterium]|jgi:hypothetical protein
MYYAEFNYQNLFRLIINKIFKGIFINRLGHKKSSLTGA